MLKIKVHKGFLALSREVPTQGRNGNAAGTRRVSLGHVPKCGPIPDELWDTLDEDELQSLQEYVREARVARGALSAAQLAEIDEQQAIVRRAAVNAASVKAVRYIGIALSEACADPDTSLRWSALTVLHNALRQGMVSAEQRDEIKVISDTQGAQVRSHKPWCGHAAAIYARHDSKTCIGVVSDAQSGELVTARDLTPAECARMTTGNAAGMIEIIDRTLYRRLAAD